MASVSQINRDARSLKSIVVIEPSREMQRLLRAMLSSFGIRDVRIFADSQRAASAILSDPPDVVLMDWDVSPYTGPNFLKLFRHKKMHPVCLMPIVMMFARASQQTVEQALKLGAHAVLVKPMAPNVLVERLLWATNTNIKMRLSGDRYVIDGITQRLESEKEKQSQLDEAREYQASQFAEMISIQNDVDSILKSNF